MKIRKLSVGIKRKGGRNNTGSITSYHRGGGVKSLCKRVDYERPSSLGEGVVVGFSGDKYRSGELAVVKYESGVYAYLLREEGDKEGIAVSNQCWESSFKGIEEWRGVVRLCDVFKGGVVYNVEGGKYSRAGGSYSQVVRVIPGGLTLLKLKSGKCRPFSGKVKSIFGVVKCNERVESSKKRNAGYNRRLGKRPKVRGVAMNPVDHPHGGGEGKSSGGRCSVSRWGRLTKSMVKRKRKGKELWEE